MLQYPIKTSLKVLKKSKFSFVYAFFIGFTFILLFSSNSGGFDSDRTGSPNSGGATCASCHGGGTGGGSVVLTNAPTTYAYNMTYNMTLTVADADMQRAGFQITAVDESNNYVGTFTPSSGMRATSTFSGLTHSTPQDPVSGMTTWSIQWNSPSTGNAQVKFYYASNAATGGGTGGDFIYTGSSNAFITLPVSLTSFEVKSIKALPTLSWTTSSEVNTKYFAIERQDREGKFMEIAQQATQGKANVPQTYSFQDQSIQSKGVTLYYRLKMVDNDGKTEYSKIISVQSQGKSKARIYPSVTAGDLIVEGATSFEIVNTMGQILLKEKQGIQNLNIGYFPRGIYIVRGVDTEGGIFSEMIIKP